MGEKQIKMDDTKILKDHYSGLDVVRVVAIAGIVFMHVLANGNFALSGFLFEKVIGTAGNFTILFMMVSAFGMCCGYYQKFRAGTINIESFYKRRYEKLWPFFALLCIFDILISPNTNNLFEVFANLTMVQGLLPNPQISVVGVSWTLAVIFVFYLLFPFFCFLLSNKKRAWLSLIVTIVYNILCQIYFFDTQHVLVNFIPRENIIYSAPFFVTGGLIYLYRNALSQCKYIKFLGVVLITVTASMYYFFSQNDLIMTLFSAIIIIFAITRNEKFGENTIIKFLSSISFEIYLCHMVIYRVLEKLHLVHLFGNDLLSYIFTSIAVICGSVIFSICAKWFLNKIEILLKKRRLRES